MAFTRDDLQRTRRMKTEVIAVPSGWEHLPYHPLSKTVEFGIGINVEEMAVFMKEHGYDENESIIIYRDQILDGRHKHAAAIIAGITPTFRRFVGKSAEAYVAKKAFRQHLSASQRAMLAADMVTTNGAGRPELIVGIPTINEAEVAKKLNVSRDSVNTASKVKKHGTEELQDAVREGVVTVNDAAAVATEKPEVQEQAVKKVKEKKAKTAKAAVEKIKEAAPEAEDEPWVDAWGIPITKEAEPAFRNAEKFDELLKLLRQAKKLYKELADLPGGQLLRQPFVSSNSTSGFRHNGLETCIMNVSDCKPKYTICPYVYHEYTPHDKDCTFCKGLGWIGTFNKSSPPPQDFIDAAKRDHGVQV